MTNMSKKEKLMVSLLKSMYDTCPETVTMDAIYQYLILETLRSDTEKHRSCNASGLKKQAKSIKNKMLNFTPSVILSGGKDDACVVAYTGLGMADFDHIPTGDLARCFALLEADPHVVLAYRTISGEGLRVIYLTDITDVRYHADVFLQGNTYYATLLGHAFDKQCRNPARTSILCYCPRAIYHPEAKEMHIESVVQGETACNPRPGRPAAKSCALVSEAERVVEHELEASGKTYIEGHYNEYVSCALYLMNCFGVAEDEATGWAVARFADYEAVQLRSIARSVYLHTDEHGSRKLPQDKDKEHGSNRRVSLPEVERFISSQAELRNNVVTGHREIRLTGETAFRDLTDRDENTLWLRANKAHTCCLPQTVQMMLNSEYVDNFNPFTSYLFGLDDWDGKTDYIRWLAETVTTTDPDAFYPYFKKWFVALVASLVNPDVVNHEVLIFIGAQGKYKTTWMNRLLPPEWARYFYTKTNSGQATKDDRLTLAEFALICFEEIDDMRPSEMNQLKAMITQPNVNERSSYAHNKEQRPHVASFCGTGNKLSFLNDPTGTRRWVPFEVLSIVDPYTMTIPYAKLYAQALALYRSGFRYWFDPDEIAVLCRRNKRFEVPNMEEELVSACFRCPVAGEHGVFISSAEIIQCINVQIRYPLSLVDLGVAMRKLGFKTCRSHNIRGYRVMELTTEEMSQRRQVFEMLGD